MRQRASLSVLIGIAVVGVLAGCASGGGAASAPSSAPSLPDAQTSAPPVASPVSDGDEDAVALEKAESWLAATVMPASAVRSEVDPGTAPSLDVVGEGWWCEGTVERTAWWSIPGETVAGAANWLRQHPADGLILPAAFADPLEEDPQIDSAAVANLPEAGALEGLVLRVAKAEDGVVVRATAGAHPGPESCPTPPPGTALGGPGEG